MRHFRTDGNLCETFCRCAFVAENLKYRNIYE